MLMVAFNVAVVVGAFCGGFWFRDTTVGQSIRRSLDEAKKPKE